MALSKPAALCYLCTESEPVHGARCKPCNALFGRARTASKPLGTWDEFLDVSKEHRTNFYRHGHELMGKDLKALVEETISESYSEKEMEAWIKDGKFLDKEDMEEKFKAKPHQLKSILANTKTHYCNVRDVLLYEDPEFVSQKNRQRNQARIRSDKFLLTRI